jgi:hypothetical protein
LPARTQLYTLRVIAAQVSRGIARAAQTIVRAAAWLAAARRAARIDDAELIALPTTLAVLRLVELTQVDAARTCRKRAMPIDIALHRATRVDLIVRERAELIATARRLRRPARVFIVLVFVTARIAIYGLGVFAAAFTCVHPSVRLVVVAGRAITRASTRADGLTTKVRCPKPLGIG